VGGTTQNAREKQSLEDTNSLSSGLGGEKPVLDKEFGRKKERWTKGRAQYRKPNATEKDKRKADDASHMPENDHLTGRKYPKKNALAQKRKVRRTGLTQATIRSE